MFRDTADASRGCFSPVPLRSKHSYHDHASSTRRYGIDETVPSLTLDTANQAVKFLPLQIVKISSPIWTYDPMTNNRYQPKLIFVSEPFNGRICELELESTSVGRSSQNHLNIQDPSVSARHCEILAHDAEIIVRDLESSNGTFINGVRIKGQSQLKHGQVLRIGNIGARLELAAPDANETTSDATAVYLHSQFTREAKAERENPKLPPQPVKMGAKEGQIEAEHTVSFSKEQKENQKASPAQPLEQSASKPAPVKWVIVCGLIALAAILWWLVRK